MGRFDLVFTSYLQKPRLVKPKLTQTVDELLVNESFLNYYFRKNEADIWEWEEFQETNPTFESRVHEAFTQLDLLSLKWSESQIRELYKKLDLNEKPSFFFQHYKKIAAIAASIALVLYFSFQSYFSAVSPIYQDLTENKALIEKINTKEKPMLVLLSDGSSILLNRNARLSYPATFNSDKREVYLDGDAFFEVAKNPKVPFLVYANEIVTKVIGTSFRITALKGQKNIKVLVKTGKVSVYRLKEIKEKTQSFKGVVITQNQQIVFEKKEESFVKSLVSQPEIITLNKPQNFEYKDVPASEIFRSLEEAYGVKFIFDEGLLRDCTITASLIDEPLYEKLQLICLAIEAEYELIDGQIIISSKGCK